MKPWFLLILMTAACWATIDDPALNEARALVKQYMKSLKTELMASLAEGGPEQAIAVCNEQAPRIAAHLSTNSTWTVARTSLKTRSETNAPDEWERGVLLAFDKQVKGGADPETLEFAEEINGEFRYMKAIPTAALCLTCHGSEIAPPVQNRLSELYPKDQAVGYSVGELRGAFSLRQAQ
jgi:hypothetical protein